MSRRRYRFNEETQAMEEIGRDWSDTPRRAQTPTEELVYGHAGRATDGTPIDSRRKHREYMQRTGLALASDYQESWSKAAEKRAEFFTTGGDRQARREAIERAAYQLSNRKKR